MNWRQWLHGLGAAAIGSLSTAIGSVIGGNLLGYDVFDISFWQIVGGGLVVNGLLAVALYVKTFPPPGTLKPQERPWDGE
ncbi:MAG: hypothetical protein V1790_17505 [Planctomycetota bacterium]